MEHISWKERREVKKQEKWKEQNCNGIIGRKNEFGATDLTGHNAHGRMVSKKFSIQYK